MNLTEDIAANALPTVQAAAAFDYGTMVLNVIERLGAMFTHIGLTVIVYYSVVNAKTVFLPVAILLHMLADSIPALHQKGVVPLWAVEVWLALWAAVIMFIAVKLYREMKVASSSETV